MTPAKKLQVFVSSTYNDLKTERQAAVEAILKAGHIPAGMELFSAGSESQMETIRRWIDDSDIYMLFLGARYGSIEPKTSLSYTELEYDYALKNGKPTFAVVISESAIDPKVRIDGRSAIELEHPKELKFFREKVLSKTSSFFAEPKDIKLAVHETLADYIRRFEFTGWVSGREVVDTAPLLDEIRRLSHEKEQAIKALAELKTKVPVPIKQSQAKWTDQELGECAALLNTLEVSTKVFQTSEDAAPKTYTILELLLMLGDRLVTGISNRYDATPRDAFIYYNVCPKLEIYELAVLEKVSGVIWQRYKLAPKGKALLALAGRTAAKAKQPKAATNSSPTPASPPTLAAKRRAKRSGA